MMSHSIQAGMVLWVLVAVGSPARGQEAGEVERLIGVIGSDAAREQKAAACRRLAVVGTGKAVPALAALLGDAEMSHTARYALETIGDSSVDAALREALGRTEGLQLVGVIGSVGVRRDAEAVEALVKLLGDEDQRVVQAAARALGKIGNSAAAKAIEAGLAGAEEESRAAFYEGMLRSAELLALGGGRGQAIGIHDRLRISSAPHQVRAGGMRGAILTRGEEGLGLLKEALTGSDDSLAAVGALCAQEMSVSGVTAVLVEAMGQGSADRKVLILRTLGKRRDGEALAAVSALTQGAPKEVRIAAIETVSEIGGASSAPLLAGLMKDADGDVARLAQEGLAGLAGAEVDAAVMGMFESRDGRDRVRAVELMGRRRAATTPVLLKAMDDPDAAVRLSAVKWLGELGGNAELAAMLELLMRSEGDMLAAMEAAVTATCQREGDADACAGRLAELLPKAAGAKKEVVLRILGAVGGGKALEVVRGVIKESGSDAGTRIAAIRALSTWKDTGAGRDLLAAAKNGSGGADGLLALRGYLGLANRPSVTAEQRLAMAKEAAGVVSRVEEKKLLLGTLGGMQEAGALELVSVYLEDEGTKEEAATAASAIAEKILGRRAGTVPAPVAIMLEKAAGVTGNAELRDRLRRQAQQAKERLQPTR